MTNIFMNNDTINNSIRIFLERKLKFYGEFRYAYLVMNKRNTAQVKIISSYPSEWVEIYKTNKLQYIDPVIISALQRIMPFSWDENVKVTTSGKLASIFNHSKKYNIINGYTFTLHDQHHNLAILSLIIDDQGEHGIEDMIENNKEKIQMLLIKSHDRMLTMYRSISNKKNLKKPEAENTFSKRENDILYWSSMGKTYHDISLILNIKVGTVKFHMGNVVKKLGVLNAKHAIRLGIELDIITPP